MTDFFFSVMSVLLVLYLILVLSTDNIANDIHKLHKYNGYVVTNKTDGFFLSNYTTLRKDTLSYEFRSEDIVFDSLKVGDTINIK